MYVVPSRDRAIFTLGRLPDAARRRQRAEDMAARVHAHLAGRRLKDNDVQKALGVGNAIKYATTTGTVLIRWDGARTPAIWTESRAMAVTGAGERDAKIRERGRFLG